MIAANDKKLRCAELDRNRAACRHAGISACQGDGFSPSCAARSKASADRPALRITPTDQSFRLRLQVRFVLTRRHSCVDGDDLLLRWRCTHLIDWRIDDHRASRQLVAINLAPFPHAPGRVVVNPDVLGITRQLHICKYTIPTWVLLEMGIFCENLWQKMEAFHHTFYPYQSNNFQIFSVINTEM